ncbi:CocE/NonD family hydrolase C-terminal non-catalytic domain-containing protein, partial [Streptococcus pyogenes]
NNYRLPTVIWQDNSADQTWTSLEDFGAAKQQVFPLGKEIASIQQAYEEETFATYCKSYAAFHQDLYAGKANQINIDIPVKEDILLNGPMQLQ